MKRFRYTKIKEIVQSRPIETQEELAKALQEEGIEVTQATVSGSASMVASAVDHAKWERVIGTVAGDDTVLIITNNPDSVPKLVKLIISLMKE